MQSHLTSTSITETRGQTRPVEIVPGFGANNLFIGQSEGSLIDLWRIPDRKVQHKDSMYFIYKALALEVELCSNRVERLFFYAGHRPKTGLRIAGMEVNFGVSRQHVIQKFGDPERQGNGRTILNKYVRAWLYYPTGIQFEFGKDGKLELMTIFPPGRAGTRG